MVEVAAEADARRPRRAGTVSATSRARAVTATRPDAHRRSRPAPEAGAPRAASGSTGPGTRGRRQRRQRRHHERDGVQHEAAAAHTPASDHHAAVVLVRPVVRQPHRRPDVVVLGHSAVSAWTISPREARQAGTTAASTPTATPTHRGRGERDPGQQGERHGEVGLGPHDDDPEHHAEDDAHRGAVERHEDRLPPHRRARLGPASCPRPAAGRSRGGARRRTAPASWRCRRRRSRPTGRGARRPRRARP